MRRFRNYRRTQPRAGVTGAKQVTEERKEVEEIKFRD